MTDSTSMIVLTLIPVDVLIVPFGGHPQTTGDPSPLELKRQEIWENEIRNRVIREIANQLCTEDGRYSRRYHESLSGPKRVAVLVENVEHAAELLRSRIQWCLLTAPALDLEGLEKGPRKRIEKALRRDLGPFAIITHGGAPSVDFGKFDVLIRADAGTCLPPALAHATLAADDPHRLLLIDFTDPHHPVLQRWSKTRHDKYAQAGWYAIGVDPIDQRCKHFLNSR